MTNSAYGNAISGIVWAAPGDLIQVGGYHPDLPIYPYPGVAHNAFYCYLINEE